MKIFSFLRASNLFAGAWREGRTGRSEKVERKKVWLKGEGSALCAPQAVNFFDVCLAQRVEEKKILRSCRKTPLCHWSTHLIFKNLRKDSSTPWIISSLRPSFLSATDSSFTRQPSPRPILLQTLHSINPARRAILTTNSLSQKRSSPINLKFSLGSLLHSIKFARHITLSANLSTPYLLLC